MSATPFFSSPSSFFTASASLVRRSASFSPSLFARASTVSCARARRSSSSNALRATSRSPIASRVALTDSLCLAPNAIARFSASSRARSASDSASASRLASSLAARSSGALAERHGPTSSRSPASDGAREFPREGKAEGVAEANTSSPPPPSVPCSRHAFSSCSIWPASCMPIARALSPSIPSSALSDARSSARSFSTTSRLAARTATPPPRRALLIVERRKPPRAPGRAPKPKPERCAMSVAAERICASASSSASSANRSAVPTVPPTVTRGRTHSSFGS
mmetsp:Transcript_24113/g.61005  ORF Transcript_24113/g.61005 Transcript_24113/m.61005 type:complete len:281 (-) Transcript_24113:148-990(-)